VLDLELPVVLGGAVGDARVLHTPGHTLGHLLVFAPGSVTASIADAELHVSRYMREANDARVRVAALATGLRAREVTCRITDPDALVDLYNAAHVAFGNGAIGVISGAATLPRDDKFQLDSRLARQTRYARTLFVMLKVVLQARRRASRF
jgi:hypothetical protein